MDSDDGFVEFVSARWSRLYRLAYLLTSDEAAAEDLLQSAMEKTYARWPRVSRMAEPEAYVRKLMVNAAISTRRRPMSRWEWLPGVVPERSGSPEDSGVVDHAVLWPLVLGCAVGTVKSQAHDAMRALRRGLGAAQPGEVLER